MTPCEEPKFCPTCGKQGATYNSMYNEYMIFCTCENWDCPKKIFSNDFYTDYEAIEDWNEKISKLTL